MAGLFEAERPREQRTTHREMSRPVTEHVARQDHGGIDEDRVGLWSLGKEGATMIRLTVDVEVLEMMTAAMKCIPHVLNEERGK